MRNPRVSEILQWKKTTRSGEAIDQFPFWVTCVRDILTLRTEEGCCNVPEGEGCKDFLVLGQNTKNLCVINYTLSNLETVQSFTLYFSLLNIT